MMTPIGITEHGDIVFGTLPVCEDFTPTLQLRLVVPEGYDATHDGKRFHRPILQQAWQGSRGTVLWQAVPVVEVTVAEYMAASASDPK